MSATSDAVWIVRDVLEEILGMVFFRDVQEKFEAEMITEKNDRIEVNEKCDWVSLIDAEKKSWIDGDCDCDCDCSCEATSEEMKFVDGDVKPADCDFCFGRCICEEKGGNHETNVTERKERKFPEYAMMRFNWKEVEPIFKGQLERWMTLWMIFRYV